jgi:hypothetical protein
MLRSVEGVFTNGHVELREEAPAVEGAQVIVTFLAKEPVVTPEVPYPDPLTALQKLAELRRDLPTVDAVELVLEGREDLAARSQI